MDIKNAGINILEPSYKLENQAVAQDILEQVTDACWTALEDIEAPRRKRVPVESGVLLRKVVVHRDHEKGRNNWGNIQISLNGQETYDMAGWTTDKHGSHKVTVFDYKNVTGDQLGLILHKIIFSE